MPFRGQDPPPRPHEQPNPGFNPFGPNPPPPPRGILGPAGNVPPPVINTPWGPLHDFDLKGIKDAESAAEDEARMQWDMEKKYNSQPKPFGGPHSPLSAEALQPDFLQRQLDAWEFGKPNWRTNPVPPPPQPRPPLR